MRVDPIIQRRFEELEAKAEAIASTKEFDFASEGKRYFTIPTQAFKGWATSVLSLLQRAFGETSVHYRHFQDQYENWSGWESAFETSRSIFLAAKEDFEGGYLFSVIALAKAEVLDDALEQAKELLNHGYKDPACVLSGIALETTLKELCLRNGISTGKLDRMNADLRKAGVYNIAKQKQITAWADLRNKAAHGDWSAYTESDVHNFLTGAENFIADYF